MTCLNDVGVIGDPSARVRWFASLARAWKGWTKRRRVPFQLAVNQPEVGVTVMQGFRVPRVAEPDRLDDVFQCQIDEADLAVLRLTQLRLIGLGGVLDAVVQGWRDRDEIAFVIEPVVDHALGEEMFSPELLQRVGPERRG